MHWIYYKIDIIDFIPYFLLPAGVKRITFKLAAALFSAAEVLLNPFFGQKANPVIRECYKPCSKYHVPQNIQYTLDFPPQP